MKLKKIVSALSVAILSGAVMTGCGGGSSSSGLSDAEILTKTKMVLDTNADIAYAAYSDSVTTAQALHDAIDAFAAEPTQANLDAAKDAWLAAREPYGQTEVYRFRLSPIDSTNYADEDGPEGDINAWPLGEALIDYVTTGDDFGDDQVGVTAHSTDVNGGDPILGADITTANTIIGSTVTINEALISNTATAEDEHDVIAGYHAIEFMLWGQDLNESAPVADNPRDNTGGQRPLTDFTTADNADRRIAYMQVVADKLVADLTSVRDAWAEGSEYRTAFTGVDTQEAANEKITEILTAMGTMGASELAGERMQIALTTNSQEDEHSCFSDNTHRDIVTNALGIANQYYGDYAGYDSNDDGVADVTTNAVSGYGIDDLLADLGEDDAATDFAALLTATKNGYDAIDTAARAGTPFDNQIQNGANDDAAESVRDTILALNAQSQAIKNSLVDALGADDFDPNADTDCDVSDPASSC